MGPRPQPALFAGGELPVREDLRGRLSDGTPEDPRPGRPERAFVPRTPGPRCADRHRNQGQDRENREHGDECRVREHACVAERPGAGAERTRGGDHRDKEGSSGHVDEPEGAPVVDDARHRTRIRVAVRRELPERAHDAGRLGIGRALRGALGAAVAVPDVLVGSEAVLKAKPDEGDLTAREGSLLTGKLARGSAGATLQARLERRYVQAVGLEEGALGVGGEIERPVRQHVDRPATNEPAEVARTGLGKRRTSRTHHHHPTAIS